MCILVSLILLRPKQKMNEPIKVNSGVEIFDIFWKIFTRMKLMKTNEMENHKFLAQKSIMERFSFKMKKKIKQKQKVLQIMSTKSMQQIINLPGEIIFKNNVGKR